MVGQQQQQQAEALTARLCTLQLPLVVLVVAAVVGCMAGAQQQQQEDRQECCQPLFVAAAQQPTVVAATAPAAAAVVVVVLVVFVALLRCTTTFPSAAATPRQPRDPAPGCCLAAALDTRCGAQHCALLLPATATGGWRSNALPLLAAHPSSSSRDQHLLVHTSVEVAAAEWVQVAAGGAVGAVVMRTVVVVVG